LLELEAGSASIRMMAAKHAVSMDLMHGMSSHNLPLKPELKQTKNVILNTGQLRGIIGNIPFYRWPSAWASCMVCHVFPSDRSVQLFFVKRCIPNLL
jgi:hypothetical protein